MQNQRKAAKFNHTLRAPGVICCPACLPCLPAYLSVCLPCRPAGLPVCSTNVGGSMSTGDNGFTVQLPAGVTLPSPDPVLTPGAGSPPGKPTA